jgi:uncharacterized protein (DUF697 family)
MAETHDPRRAQAQSIIDGVAKASEAVSSAVLPFSSDTAALQHLHVGMIQTLGKLFGTELDARRATGMLQELAGPLLGTTTALTLLGYLPGVGNLVNATVSKGYTQAIGWKAYHIFANSTSSRTARDTLFICYSHKDSQYVERLLVHLRPVQDVLRTFVDTSLAPGVEWRKKLAAALDEARVAVLFISADFAASDFIQKYEVPALIDAAKKESAIILPVLVGPVVKTSVVNSLLEYQSPATDLQPLMTMRKPQREKVFAQIAEACIDAFGRRK